MSGHEHNHEHGAGQLNTTREIVLIGTALALLVVGSIFRDALHDTPYAIAEYVVFLLAYGISGWNVVFSAVRNASKGTFFDENFLMTIATVGAFLLHEMPEAVGVMVFFKVGEFLQDLAVERSRRSIVAVLELRPEYANLKQGDTISKVTPDTVKIGDVIIIKPGEQVPLDGEITSGQSRVNTAALTGESVPRQVGPGEVVLAGMVNQTGVLTVTVTKPVGESAIARVIQLVEQSSSLKSKTEKFITKFATYYTPVVVLAAVAVALLPPLIWPGEAFADWMRRALILLVISCPCGLVISIPLGYFGGVGGAAKRGIMVKGSTYLDSLAATRTVVFDKTGTLTQGVFKVTGIYPQTGFVEEELLRLTAFAEVHSSHPIAQSIMEAYGQSVDASSLADYEEIAGHGIRARIGTQEVLVGNERLLRRENITVEPVQEAGTVVYLAIDQVYAGYLVIADELKADAPSIVAGLKAAGVEQVGMLSGDRELVAQDVASKLGLDFYRAGLLPEQKVAFVEELLQRAENGKKIAFVGDGINDAPVIARADVGIAMGGLGSDAAVETADVVIMSDAPSKVAEAIQIGRKTRRIVWQNVVFALGVKGVFIALGIAGAATMWEAVFADVGVALLAVLNAGRVLR
ncbi:Cd2+/Zn2+-exporting ATPase [Anaerospora hongkongensis]|uniref:Cd(2+)-exporting ATPase n=1 Tax=Anaerospora hongkongensis TaxID=244830 RepID=A0A4R1PZS6_9FIRM|nr:heavy metal translocating P-type ATPase [Anaerospora hongkongensis]TCL37191.1 Cd2+/Zn2+-exporting ATPase [Anaerospora hongkongensis]